MKQKPLSVIGKVPAKIKIMLGLVVVTIMLLVGSRIYFDDADTYALQSSAYGTAQVRMVYLVPSDRVDALDHTISLDHNLLVFKEWYNNQLTEYAESSLSYLAAESMTARASLNSTFAVERYVTNHPASYYNGKGNAGDFWERVIADGFALTGGQFDDPNNAWIFYIDAAPLPNQYVGGTNGVAVMHRADLMGIFGDAEDGTSVDRWIGGSGHEIGHALGLPHPPGCDEDQSSQLCQDALMFLGYLKFPNTYLTKDNLTALMNSPFVTKTLTRKPIMRRIYDSFDGSGLYSKQNRQNLYY